MGKHSIAGTHVSASKIEKKYQERLDWREKIITGERQETDPSAPIVWPFTDTLRDTQD